MYFNHRGFLLMGMFYGSIQHTTSGRKKKSITRRSRSTIRAVQSNTHQSYRRETPEYRSAPDTVGAAPRVESPQYTGTLVKGIGTMHKSNAVPIIDEQHMKDIARMRR
jgi:hypothetical protein